MADLLEDSSPIRLGTTGVFRNEHFAVVGRIQLQHPSGVWNEWHLLFDQGRSGWLSDAGGEYVVSTLTAVNETLPAFETLKPEMPLTIAGRKVQVTDLETARCIAGEGELPFKVDAGYDVATADLRGSDRFVTLDYSETPPLVFVGQAVRFADLALGNLRDPAATGASRIAARAFNCPHCAAPLAIHSKAIASVACDGCGSIIGINNENVRLLARAAQALRETPWLPLGSVGNLNGIAWEAIGFLRRTTSADGVDYSWAEYLLHNAEAGFAWLTEAQGHWNFARTLSAPPAGSRDKKAFKFDGREFRLFSTCKARISYVVGEFYWRVAVGETAQISDYISPPTMLSREVSEKEVVWSQGEYLDAEELRAAFKVEAPPLKQSGVFANQPNLLVERHRHICRLFWKLAALATLLQLLLSFVFSSQLVLREQFVLSPQNEDAGRETREFVLSSRARTLLVRHSTDVDNNWLSLTSTLIEKKTGEAYQGTQEVAHYKGVDDGESWSEGSRSDEIVFKGIPPGSYTLAIDYELGADRRDAVVDTVEVVRNPAGWANYVLLLIFLAVFPLYSRWRRNAFDAKRWSESDFGDEASEGED